MRSALLGRVCVGPNVWEKSAEIQTLRWLTIFDLSEVEVIPTSHVSPLHAFLKAQPLGNSYGGKPAHICRYADMYAYLSPAHHSNLCAILTVISQPHIIHYKYR